MYGKVESLNASVAGALIMYEVVRARELKKKKIINPYILNEPTLEFLSPMAEQQKLISEQIEKEENSETKKKKKTKKQQK
jgi:hypothetical protein